MCLKSGTSDRGYLRSGYLRWCPDERNLDLRALWRPEKTDPYLDVVNASEHETGVI